MPTQPKQSTLYCIVALLSFITLPTTAAAQDAEWSIKFVLGAKAPLARACYEKARDGEEDYKALEPCNRSLAEEKLSDRWRAGVHANRGVIYYNIGDYEAAISDFTMSLDLGINLKAKLRTNRGLSYEALGHESLARTEYMAALAINPNYRVAKERVEELKKPLYERIRQPRKITVEVPKSLTPII